MDTSILQFVELTHAFQKVQRAIYATGEDRLENDAEHSYQVALVAWYVINHASLPLDSGKVIRYALVHDLVEAYAGDTDAYGPEEHKRTKHEREAAAAGQLRVAFPDFTELHDLIQAYELRKDEESKFVYALDKVLPGVNIYLDKGRKWKEQGRTLQDIKNEKNEKVAVSEHVEKIYKEFVLLLERDREQLFNPVQTTSN